MTTPTPGDPGLEVVTRLAREVRSSGMNLDRDQARFLVDVYYRVQEHRIALGGQERALIANDRPTDIVHHFGDQMSTLERQMVSVLDVFTQASGVGRWSRAQVGVGPIIAAGLLAHIDITKAPTVGHIWSFAGLNPQAKWEKGQKRPWNADLKVLCWKLGDSFVKVSGRENAFYGKLYRERKDLEVTRNDERMFADQAAATLREKNIREAATRKCYEDGKLPPGRIDLRARRWAVKLFLSHWHEVAYREHYDAAPPLPYVMAHLGHVDLIPPPAADAA